ncbi:PilN domain-containing protein [Nitrosococcus wardiae]|uniref:Twitching motility protein PilT n=1 Tax=Nitrosococcus wardiae TaxID=1814290 RepID=A0A4P7BW63_9GAMM|nr:PilN domain-containing protein [Nitrosococcus wardiae]QBQ53537.1 twitching motility protein PilT [Nitrosococcus wardiae]
MGAQALSKNVLSSFNISGFLSWWGQGLLCCLPSGVRQLFWHETTRLVLEPQGKGVRLHRERGESKEDLGFYNGIERGDERFEGKDKVLVFRLSPEQTLSKPITLPLAAEENLRQVLGFEMERHTPFATNQVYYDFEVIKRSLEAHHLIVRLVVVPRRILDEWLERLSHWGLQPAIVDVMGTGPGRINLLPDEKRSSRSKALPRINMALSLLLMVFTGAALLFPLWQERSVVIDLMSKVSAAQEKAEAVIAIRQRLEKAIEASEFLVEEKEQYPSAVEFLYELTRILPDGIWLQQLDFTRGKIKVRGEATEASALIPILEASPYFQDVQFRSPVTTNARTGRDRFYITAQLPKLESLPL